ncbi:dinitrogenase iron-molybdenum cofactor biosynthesis protein [Marinilabiliaceae bacterium JC017]|nr:dinitrogenase iron-molybdenum cofactor biosynthesis protein [Marinilabiliaceae bacterium JC017]
MKTVITSTGNSTDSPFDLRFGRAAHYCILDADTNETTFIENEYANAQGGAGTKAAEKMVELGVKRVISGDFGPKAKELLERFKIQMVVLNGEDKTVQEIINTLKAN